MPAATLTAARLKQLTVPPKGVVLELRDLSKPGLSLRAFASGRFTWSYRYRPKNGGSRRRYTLGDYPTVSLAEARRRYDRLKGQVADKRDPQGALRTERLAPKLEELIDRYLREEVGPKKKARTLELYTYYLREKLPEWLVKKRAQDITPADVDRLHRSLGAETPVTANRVVVSLSGVFTFAARRRLLPEAVNPARGVEKFREAGRDRYLSTAELIRLGDALRFGELEGFPWRADQPRRKHGRKAEDRKSLLSQHVAAAVRLLLLTGCRLREILRLRWSEVDLERGLLLLPDSKTGRKTVVLNAPAMQVLNALPRVESCDFVILGDETDRPRADLNKPWRLIRDHAQLTGVRIHDLRHTHASVGAGAGLGLPIIGKLLGHKHVDTTARYAHLDNDPLRRASDRIGGEIVAALDGRPHDHDNVKRLANGR